jgi:hypothetical protein
VIAEPVPLYLGQVLDQAKNGGATAGQDAAQLFIRQPIGLLQHAVPGERQERQGRVELARVDARHGLPLGLRHAATLTCGQIKQTDRRVAAAAEWPRLSGPRAGAVIGC